MRNIELFSLILVVVFAVTGCKKQEPESPRQIPVQTPNEPAEPKIEPEPQADPEVKKEAPPEEAPAKIELQPAEEEIAEESAEIEESVEPEEPLDPDMTLRQAVAKGDFHLIGRLIAAGCADPGENSVLDRNEAPGIVQADPAPPNKRRFAETTVPPCASNTVHGASDSTLDGICNMFRRPFTRFTIRFLFHDVFGRD